MKIIDIDIIPIYPKIADRNADQKARFFNINHRTIFKITTDNGIVGYGDARCEAPLKSTVKHLIDRDPFDFINADLNSGLMGALYDAMGKYLELPAYKLMGQKIRDQRTRSLPGPARPPQKTWPKKFSEPRKKGI